MEACIISNNAPLRVSVSSNIFDESNEVFGVHSICLSLNSIKLLLRECNYEKHRKRVIIQFYKTLFSYFWPSFVFVILWTNRELIQENLFNFYIFKFYLDHWWLKEFSNALCCYCIFFYFTKAFKTYNEAFALVFFLLKNLKSLRVFQHPSNASLLNLLSVYKTFNVPYSYW